MRRTLDRRTFGSSPRSLSRASIGICWSLCYHHSTSLVSADHFTPPVWRGPGGRWAGGLTTYPFVPLCRPSPGSPCGASAPVWPPLVAPAVACYCPLCLPPPGGGGGPRPGRGGDGGPPPPPRGGGGVGPWWGPPLGESALIQTGIYGLDAIFLGGILKGNLILVEGAPGTGKTLLGVEFIYRGLPSTTSPASSWCLRRPRRSSSAMPAASAGTWTSCSSTNKLKIIFTSPQVLDQELRSPDSLLLETAAEMGAQRIFIDGISLRSLPAPLARRQRQRGRLLPRAVTAVDRRAAPREPDRDALARGHGARGRRPPPWRWRSSSPTP